MTETETEKTRKTPAEIKASRLAAAERRHGVAQRKVERLTARLEPLKVELEEHGTKLEAAKADLKSAAAHVAWVKAMPTEETLDAEGDEPEAADYDAAGDPID